MDVQAWFDRRVDLTQFMGGVALGDLVAITLLIAVGQSHHGGAPLERPVGVLEGAIPFYVAWVLVALLAGLYTRDSVVSPRRAAAWTIPAWIVADVAAVLLRGTPAFAGNVSFVFAIVTAFVGGALLIGWRTSVPIIRRRTLRRRAARDESRL